MTGYFEKDPENKSMMRLLAFLGFITGAVVALWGMVLMTMLVFAVMRNVEGAGGSLGTILMIVSGGLVLAGGSEAAKALQQRGEAKEGLIHVPGN